MTRPALIDDARINQRIRGYGALLDTDESETPDVTTDEYAANQEHVNDGKVINYLLPLARSLEAKTVLDVGCGIGAMVRTFLRENFDAFGADLPGLTSHWQRLEMPCERMFVIDPVDFRLPFKDDSMDFVYTLGVIEHVGTTNGHSDRRPDYHQHRKAWLRELMRVVRPGGSALIAGPNRGFPVDAAHDLDTRASNLERWLSNKLGVSVHKTWGENFLWSYRDVQNYLKGGNFALTPLSVEGFLSFSRVPGPVKPLVNGYVRHLPRRLLGTGFNPWVMALVTKPTAANKIKEQ